ncbi:hypothetical protein [Vogesella indigofera]|uniref:hypothetical protein n=1 Tax=Vogesella indigofera TaxID=45465 RepID=UPI00234E7248|nr:hypothetical protein [Vogesella indigofera]MDC7697253.1 hypothetical protein [Vogesella indigofera]
MCLEGQQQPGHARLGEATKAVGVGNAGQAEVARPEAAGQPQRQRVLVTVQQGEFVQAEQRPSLSCRIAQQAGRQLAHLQQDAYQRQRLRLHPRHGGNQRGRRGAALPLVTFVELVIGQ